MTCLFIFITTSFEKQTFTILMKLNLACAFCILFMKSLRNPKSLGFLLFFFSQSLISLASIFSLMILSVNFCKWCKLLIRVLFFFLYMDIWLLQDYVLKRLSFTNGLAPLSKIYWLWLYIYTFGPSFSLIFMPMPYCLDYYSLLISHKIRQVNIFSFVIFKSYFGCSESFVFP